MNPYEMSLGDYAEYSKAYDTYYATKQAKHLKENFEDIEILMISDKLILIKGDKND